MCLCIYIRALGQCIIVMESKSNKEEIRRISINKIRRHFTDGGFESENFIISPLIGFKSMVGEPRVIEDGVTIGIICNGTAKAEINGREYELRKDYLLLLNEESVISNFKCSKACVGYLITFSRNFLNSVDVDVADYMKARMFINLMPCVYVGGEDIERLHSIAALLSSYAVSEEYNYKRSVVSSLFSAFFYMLTSIISDFSVQDFDHMQTNRTDVLLVKFITLLCEECERERSVEYYADQLGITPKYLSLICKKRTGDNASKIIDEVVIRKAKELLSQSGMSVLEVSERLNFVSQSFFGKYFKQRVGISPSRYKSAE